MVIDVPEYYQGNCTILVMEHNISVDIQVHCAAHANLKIRLIIAYPEFLRMNIVLMLCGDQSNVIVDGMCVLSQQQRVELLTRQIHFGKKTMSSFSMQGLLSGQAYCKHDGMIRIEEQAYQTVARQQSKNILLSSKACAISIPNIEVLHHDVQCYHGTAVGKFCKNQIEYMHSRGLSYRMIEKMLVQALFEHVLHAYEKKEFILQKIYENL